MDRPMNNPDDSVEEWDINEFISSMFTEDLQHAKYDDNREPSTQKAIPDTAPGTSAPLPAPNVTNCTESTQTSSGTIDVTANILSPGFTTTDFGIEPATSGEVSRSTQKVFQELPPEDEFFFSADLDPDRNSATCMEIIPQVGTDADHHEQQASSFNAAQDYTLGFSGSDANLSTTPFVDFDWLSPSISLKTAECPQTANTTTWDFPPEDGWSSFSNMAPPAADLTHAHNPAWMPLLAGPAPSFEAPTSAIPAGTVNPDPSEKMPHPSSMPLPPTQIAPTVCNRQRHPLPRIARGTNAPILPRDSPSNNSFVAGNQQDPSDPSDASLEIALVPQAHASATRSGNKRMRNAQEDIIPTSHLYEFNLSKSVGFRGDEKQLSDPQKRTMRDNGRVKSSCLRCFFQRKKVKHSISCSLQLELTYAKCSESLPCAPCRKLFHRRANKHSDVAVQRVPWTCCIDTDLSKLNFFHQSMLLYVSAIEQRLISAVATLDNDIADALEDNCSVDRLTTAPSLDQYLQRIKPHVGNLMRVVEEMACDAGSQTFEDVQVFRAAVLVRVTALISARFFVWLIPLLSQKHVHLRHRISYRGTNSNLGCIFAVAMLAPKKITNAAKFSDRELRDFLIKISAAFFASTMKMLKDAKSKKDTHMEKWLSLNDRLITIYILTEYLVMIRLRLAQMLLHLRRRANLHLKQRANVAMHEAPKGKDSDVFQALDDATRRYKATENKEGLHHLRNYVLHWLEWLQRGSSTTSRIATKSAPRSMYSAGECEDPLEAELEEWIQRSAEQASGGLSCLTGHICRKLVLMGFVTQSDSTMKIYSTNA